MKAIKRILLFLIIVAAALSFTACGDSAEIASKTPLDVRYTPQHQEFVTDYEYKYNWWTGDFELVPNMHTETIPDKYEVLYHIEYTDGSTADNQLVMSVQPPTKSIVKIARICAKHNFDMEVSINEQQEQ